MKTTIDFLTIEIGSTITKVNGFVRSPDSGLQHVAQGFSPTTVLAGDVGRGVDAAIRDLESRTTCDRSAAEVFVNSSAAGGLRMTVHGLTYNMTARAAKEASLGAGAIVKMVTAGRLSRFDLDEVRQIKPNLILLAGGVDFGARDAVLENAELLAGLDLMIPILYAGNSALQKPVREIFAARGQEVHIAPNVFPDVDILNVDPLRKLIHEAFARHIIHAPGMDRLAELTRHAVLPTPGAVLKAAEAFAVTVGDTLVLDVGGATTDIHSVTDGSPEYAEKRVDPEPRAKRTVEGDLGVYVNAENLFAADPEAPWARKRDRLRAVPESEEERGLTAWLCAKAVEVGVRRHAGVVQDLFTPTGRKQVVKGKDLSAVRWVVGTGGALTRIPGGDKILASICTGPAKYLFPRPTAKVWLDRNYLFSALGTMVEFIPREVGETFSRLVAGDSISTVEQTREANESP